MPNVQLISKKHACTYVIDNQPNNVQVHDPRITKGI